MKWLSLFSGIGGFDLALKNLGHEIVGACEIDKYARQIYGKHFPEVKIYEDATKINPDNLPDFDILVAGFPCQAFSIAGKRRGFEDTRGTLFFEIARIAQKKRPQYLLLENVKGLLSHDGGKTIRKIYQTLNELGYDTESRIINTKDFLPQNRERIFIICHLRGTGRREIFPIRETIQQSDKRNPKIKSLGSFPIPFMRRKTEPSQSQICKFLKDNKTTSLAKLSRLTKITKTQLEHYFRNDSSGALPDKNNWLKLKDVMKFDNTYDNIMTEYVEDYMTHEMQTRVHDSTGLAPTLTSGEKFIAVSIENTGANGRRIKDEGDPQFRDKQNCGVGVLNNQRIRRLTPIECERLQGFPDNYTEGISDTQRYKCIGNAVTVPVVKYIISKLALQKIKGGNQ